MKARKMFPLLGLVSLALASCAGIGYSSIGRTWTVRPKETIRSDPIRAHRAVTLSVSGRLDSGSVSALVFRDGLLIGEALTIPAGKADGRAVYPFEEGAWYFVASADAAAKGELYLSISDR